MAKTTSVFFPKELDERLRERAEKEGRKTSDIIRDGLQTYLEMDPDLMRNARRLGAALEVSPITVIQNLAISRLAYLEAEREIWGIPREGVFLEFMKEDDNTVTGKDLFDRLKLMNSRRMEREKIDFLRDQLDKGYPIADHEREWLRQRTSTSRG